jgi:hypothetical protein
MYTEQDRQRTNKRNIETRSCNLCCSGKTKGITYCERVFVDLGILRAMRMRQIVICGMPRSTKYFHIVINGKIFEKQVTGHKIRVLISSITFFSENISLSNKN